LRGRWIIVVAVAVPLVSATEHRASPCEAGDERVVAQSVASDRYAVRAQPPASASASEPAGPRYVIRRLSTGEPIDNVACAQPGPCDLADVIGVTACSFAPVAPGKGLRDLVLEPAQADGGPASLVRAEKTARVPLVTLHAEGALALRAAIPAGRRLVVVIAETRGGACPATSERALLLDEDEARGMSSTRGDAPPAEPRRVDLDASDADDVPDLRTASPPHPMPVKALVLAARAAAASGMERLALCWIGHNAALMPRHRRHRLQRKLASDPVLARLARIAARRSHGHCADEILCSASASGAAPAGRATAR
jgi:hypothetical protein